MAYKAKKIIHTKVSGRKVEDVYTKDINCKILQIDETEYKTFLNLKFERRKPFISYDPKKIYSVIPGTVIDIMAKPGQTVKPGEAIVILEAMKMMNKILLPHGGIIKKINVKIGDVIPKKYLIVELK